MPRLVSTRSFVLALLLSSLSCMSVVGQQGGQADNGWSAAVPVASPPTTQSDLSDSFQAQRLPEIVPNSEPRPRAAELSEFRSQADATAKAGSPATAGPATGFELPVPAAAKENDTPKYPDIKMTGFFHLDSGFFAQDVANRATLGDIEDGLGFRRARLAAAGQLS